MTYTIVLMGGSRVELESDLSVDQMKGLIREHRMSRSDWIYFNDPTRDIWMVPDSVIGFETAKTKDVELGQPKRRGRKPKAEAE